MSVMRAEVTDELRVTKARLNLIKKGISGIYQSTGLPMKTALAPKASALMTSVPLVIPPLR